MTKDKKGEERENEEQSEQTRLHSGTSLMADRSYASEQLWKK